MSVRGLTALSLIALAHAAFFIWYQLPDREVAWTDQSGYRQLGASLARSGEFTRYPDAEPFVPEVIRTPGYPAFVAMAYRVAGIGNDTAVLVAQAFVFLAICLLVYAIARRILREPVARPAAFATALFPPLPYFGGLVLTELFTTAVLTAAMLVCLRATESARLRLYALAGVLFTATTMVRPAFVLLPFFLAIAVPTLVQSHRTRRHLAGWAALALSAALALVPWFTYNYVYLGAFTLSPAGGVGRGLWEGSWQGRWPGRVHAELTLLAAEPTTRDQLDRRIAAVADAHDADVDEMLAYVHQWRDIRQIWDAPRDPMDRAAARVVADREYLRAALSNISADPLQHVLRRVTSGLFVLWAGDIPIRYTAINDVPPIVIRVIWLAQTLLLVVAVAGLVGLYRSRQWLPAALLALPLVYVTAVHLPLLCEARQSLPVKPLLIIAAVAGVDVLRHRLLPGKTQVHEREHV